MRLADGVTRRIEWQTTRLSWAALPGTERHVVLVNGIEPNLRWRSFCAELLEHVERLGVTKVITLGALLTDTPHTRPTPVSGTSYDKASATRAGRRARPRYQGPTGIVGVFQNACVEAGIPAFSFWASVPHYVSQAPVPKAAVALLHRVEEVLDVEVPLGALPEQAEEWERTVSEMAEADDEVREYVRAARGAGRGVADETTRGRRRHHRRRLRALPAPPRARGGPRPAEPPLGDPACRRADRCHCGNASVWGKRRSVGYGNTSHSVSSAPVINPSQVPVPEKQDQLLADRAPSGTPGYRRSPFAVHTYCRSAHQLPLCTPTAALHTHCRSAHPLPLCTRMRTTPPMDDDARAGPAPRCITVCRAAVGVQSKGPTQTPLRRGQPYLGAASPAV